MKKVSIIIFTAALLIISSCSKPKEETTATNQQVLTDFANTVVNPNYTDLESKAQILNTAVQTLNTTTTEDNLQAARTAWRNLRQAWEQSEGYLFGPVEDESYDPMMDTWPVDQNRLDSVLASANALTLSDVDALEENLKGFHSLEYMLFGVASTKKAADFTDREKQYMVSLSQSVYNTTVNLRESWDPAHGNFTAQVVNAGVSSTRYTTRKEAFLTIVTAMAGICEEVANGKMEDPLHPGPGLLPDSTLEESHFSHNSTADFRYNITGVLNAYLGKYSADGHGLNELVAAKNISLDNKLQSQMNAAINSFNNIDANYGAAIYTQQVQIQNTQDAINALRETIEGDLTDFVNANIKD